MTVKEILLPFIFAFIATFGQCCVANIRGINLLLAPMGAGIGWLAYCLFSMQLGDLFSYFLAAVIVTIYAEVFARICKAPATGFLLIGLFPMVPGGSIYYTMKYCIDGDTAQFLNRGIHTFGIAGALALGVLVVTSFLRLHGKIKQR